MRVTERINREPSVAQLRKVNFWFFGVYAAQTAVFLLLAAVKSFPVHVSFLNLDTVQSTSLGSVVLAPATHRIFDFKAANVAATVLIISALTHLLIATYWRTNYEKSLAGGANKFRWLQLGLGSGFLISTIAVLAGAYDAMSLLLLFLLPLVAAGLGYMTEQQNPLRGRGTVKWGSYVAAGCVSVLPWLVIAGYLLFANIYGDGRIPGSTYWLAAVMFVLYAAYGVTMWLQLKKRGPWRQYRYADLSYAVLTLVTQTVFVWLLYAGVLNP
jgi:hypothetical protein